MLRPAAPQPVDILILGSGWTGTFLSPLLTELKISHAATTTTGRNGTLPFKFDPSNDDSGPYRILPSAKTVLVTFPLTGRGQSRHITTLYRSIHGTENRWIQLGSTGIYKSAGGWTDRSSPYDTTNSRAVAEDELIDTVDGCVLNLSGLYGGPRDPRNWLGRIFKNKQDVRNKAAVHLVHGQDVARAIVGCHRHWLNVQKRRWIVTDLRVYDWWDLGMSWGGEALGQLLTIHANEATESLLDETEVQARGQVARWVGECMLEEGVKALPRSSEVLGRRLDGREFWRTIDMWPSVGRIG